MKILRNSYQSLSKFCRVCPQLVRPIKLTNVHHAHNQLVKILTFPLSQPTPASYRHWRLAELRSGCQARWEQVDLCGQTGSTILTSISKNPIVPQITKCYYSGITNAVERLLHLNAVWGVKRIKRNLLRREIKMKRNLFIPGVLSLLVPGLGQIYTGEGNKGAAVIVVAIVRCHLILEHYLQVQGCRLCNRFSS